MGCVYRLYYATFPIYSIIPKHYYPDFIPEKIGEIKVQAEENQIERNCK